MGVFTDWLTGYRAKLSGRDGEQTQAGAADWWSSGPRARITQGSVLGLSAAWACVRLRARVVGQLPAAVIRTTGPTARQQDSDHWLHGLLHDSPNADQTPYEFWSNMVGCLDLWGNSYAEKTFNGAGQTAVLTPLAPDKITVARSAGQLVYRFIDRGQQVELPSEKVFHVRGLTLGGDVGLSAVAAGAQSLAGALAAEVTAANLIGRGLQISGFMETGATKLSPEQREEMVHIFNAFMGSGQAGKIMPLEKDFKFQPLRMNPVEAQLLESRAHNVEEICRWFDTPPILIGHAGDGQTMWGSGIEQIFLGWLTMGLNPLLTNIEQAARKQLLPPAERANLKVQFNREALLAADSAARAALYSSLGQNGAMYRNEMRAKENLAPDSSPNADKLTVQSNLVLLDDLGKLPPRPVQPAPGEPIP